MGLFLRKKRGTVLENIFKDRPKNKKARTVPKIKKLLEIKNPYGKI